MHRDEGPTSIGPYVGIAPFSVEDAEFFFGREREIREIISKFGVARLTILYGDSGVGKSSVLNAGVVHQLRRLARENLEESGSPELAVAVFGAWGGDPLAELKQCATQAAEWALGQALDEPVPKSLPLAEYLRTLTNHLRGELFVVLDQFEEYLRYHPGEEERGAFAAEFTDAVNSTDLRANFLVAIRKDAMADLDRFRRRIPQPFTNRIRIEHLDRQAGRDAILLPLQAYERKTNQRIDIEEELVDVVLDETAWTERDDLDAVSSDSERLSQGRIAAPLLQLVMQKLWEVEMAAGSSVLRLDTYKERIKSASRILEQHVDEHLNALTQDDRLLASQLLDRLVTPSGSKVAHAAADMALWTGRDREEVLGILETLRGRGHRILRLASAERRSYELLHDVFGPPIQRWLARFREDQRLNEERAEHERQIVEEQSRHQQRRRSLLLGSAALGAILIAATVSISLVRQQQRYHEYVAVVQKERETDEALWLLAEAGRLAALATIETRGPGDGPIVGTLLAVESMLVRPTLSGDQAIRHALPLLPLRLPEIAVEIAIVAVACSPDGTAMAAALEDGTTAIWNTTTKERTVSLPLSEPVLRMSFNASGARLATGTATRLILWDARSGERIAETPLGGPLLDIAIGTNGDLVAYAGADGATRIWNAGTAEQSSVVDLLEPLVAVSFRDDGQMLAIAGRSSVAVKNLDAPELSRAFDLGRVHDVAFGADGLRIASTNESGMLSVKNLDTGDSVVQFPLTGDMKLVSFDGTGKRLLVIGEDDDATARVVDLAGEVEVARVIEGEPITGAALSRDGETLITWSGRRVRSWRITHGGDITQARLGSSIKVATRVGDAVLIVSAAGPGKGVEVFDVATEERLAQLPTGGSSAGIALSADGRFVASIAEEGDRVDLWDLSVGSLHRSLPLDDAASAVALSPDGERLAIGTLGDAAAALVLDTGSGEVTARLPHDEHITALAFVCGTDRLVTACLDGTIHVWDVSAGGEMTRMNHGGRVSSIAISTDGTCLATGGNDKVARLWNLETGDEIVALAHGSPVWCVAFSKSGELVATGGDDGALGVWKRETGEQIARIEDPYAVRCMVFGAEEDRLIIGYDDGQTRTVPLSSDALVEAACARLPRNLTRTEWQRFLPDRPYRCTCADLPCEDSASEEE